MVNDSFWDPLPPLEDLISGNFRRSQVKETPAETENYGEENSGKFENFNKINTGEDDELEEGEIDDDDYEVKQVVKEPNQKRTKFDPVNRKGTSKLPATTGNNNNNKRNSKPSSEPKQPFVPRIVCRYYMDGVCSKGDKCTFSHSVIPNRTSDEARVKEACKFFIAGSCMKGAACHFSHDLSKFPCKFFHLRGECAAAVKGCRFSHDPISPDELERLRTAEAERIHEKERAIQTLNSLKSTTSAQQDSSLSSFCEARNKPEKTAAKNEQLALHPSLVNPFADIDDL